MRLIDNFFIIPIPIILICLGVVCIFNSKWAYKHNLNIVENFAISVKNLPILGNLAKARAEQTKWAGIWFIRIWGIFALTIGLLILYALLTQK